MCVELTRRLWSQCFLSGRLLVGTPGGELGGRCAALGEVKSEEFRKIAGRKNVRGIGSFLCQTKARTGAADEFIFVQLVKPKEELRLPVETRLGGECTPPKVHNVPYIKMLKENNTRKGFLEPVQYDKLANGSAKYGLWMRTLFELAYTYGWRDSELRVLRVEQVSVADRTIRLNRGETKNGEGREVTMTPLLRQLLQECIRRKQDDSFVLTRKDGKQVGDFRTFRSGLQWKSAVTKRGQFSNATTS